MKKAASFTVALCLLGVVACSSTVDPSPAERTGATRQASSIDPGQNDDPSSVLHDTDCDDCRPPEETGEPGGGPSEPPATVTVHGDPRVPNGGQGSSGSGSNPNGDGDNPNEMPNRPKCDAPGTPPCPDPSKFPGCPSPTGMSTNGDLCPEELGICCEFKQIPGCSYCFPDDSDPDLQGYNPKERCLNAAAGRDDVWIEYCASLRRFPRRAKCMTYTFAGYNERVGWCEWTFKGV